jgi:hypothetical protein
MLVRQQQPIRRYESARASADPHRTHPQLVEKCRVDLKSALFLHRVFRKLVERPQSLIGPSRQSNQ